MVFAVFCEKAVKWREKWKNRPRLGRFFECVCGLRGTTRSAECVLGFFELKPGMGPGFKKGVSPVATGGLRLCLKTPQTFEKV